MPAEALSKRGMLTSYIIAQNRYVRNQTHRGIIGIRINTYTLVIPPKIAKLE